MKQPKTSSVVAAILSAGLGIVAPVALEQRVMAQDLTAQTKTQYLGAVVRAPGIGGSSWGTETTFTNHSNFPSETTIVITPHGASASPEDYSKQLVLGPGESVTLNDVIGEPSIAGAFSVAATTTMGEKPAITSLIKNTQQYGSDSNNKTVLFMYQQSSDDNDFMLPGDRSTINVPQNNLYYMNARLMGKMMDGDTELPVVRISGHVGSVKMCEYDKELTNGGVIQIVKTNATAECPANNYTHFMFQQMRGKGLVEASIIYQNPDLAGANDAAIERAVKRALLEEFNVGISPNKAEVGDTLTLAGYARGRPGTTAYSMKTGWEPNNTASQIINNTTRDVSLNATATANRVIAPTLGDTTSGTPYAIATITDEDNNTWVRKITGKAISVDPAKDYSFDAAVANPIIRARKSDIANILAKGVYSLDRKQYPASEWMTTLDMYQDGIVSPNNMEAKTYRILGGALGFDVQGTDNRSDGVLFMSKQHLDQLRDILQGK